LPQLRVEVGKKFQPALRRPEFQSAWMDNSGQDAARRDFKPTGIKKDRHGRA
jgi:hypothetical protein